MAQEYESELTASRDEIAAVLSGVVDGLTAGSIRLGGEDGPVVFQIPEEVALEIELETEDDNLSLELELEWPRTDIDVEETPVDTAEELPAEDDEPPIPVEAADSSQTFARFELFLDRGDEWRWRLRHRNGNIIATSGEGYTRKHNAQKGLRSVMQNAPEAKVTEDTEN